MAEVQVQTTAQTRPRIKVLNALPVGALQVKAAHIEIREVTPELAREYAKNHEVESYIGHPSTARALSEMLGVEVPVNRAEARLEHGDRLLIAVLTRRVTGDQEVKPENLRLFWAIIWP